MLDNDYEKAIKSYEMLLSQYPIIFQVAQTYDGKALNKRFCSSMEETCLKQGINVYVTYNMNPYHYGYHALRIWSKEIGHHDMLVDIGSCELEKIIEANRFNYENFETRVLSRKNYYERELGRLKEDMKTGLDRLKQYNDLIRQANELADQFSKEFKSIHKYDFKRALL